MAIVTTGDIAERKRADEMLRTSEGRYRSLFESNPNPMWVFDVETLSFLAVNAAAVRYYGYSQDEFLAMTIKDIRPREDVPALMDNLSQVTGGLDDTTRWRHRKKDGVLIDVEITSHELTWLGRRASLVLITDITERESVLEQKRLRDEHKRLQEQLLLQFTAVETADNAVLMTDRKGAILWVNPAFTALTGYTAEDVLGKTPRLLKSDKHDQAFYRELWKTILSGKTWRGEFTNRRKDGRLFYDEHTITPVRSEGGEITHFIGIMHDVTERRQAEVELRATHAQLRQLLEHSPAVIYALKVDGQNVVPYLVSENITELLGFTVPEALHNEWWLGQLHPEDRDRTVASISETLAQGASLTEYRLRHKDGSYRSVEDKRRLIRDSSNQPMEIVGVWADTTERKRAEAVLHEMSKEEIARRKVRTVKDLGLIFLLSAVVFGLTRDFNLFHVPLRWIVQNEETSLDEIFVGLIFLLLGFVWFGFRRQKESQSRISRQANVEEALRKLHGELEVRIQQRTSELAKTNEALRAEIVQRARAGEVLRESEHRFRGMLKTVALVAMILDKNGKVTFCNDRLLQTTGWKREEIIGEDWFSNFIPDEDVAVKKVFFEAIETGEIPPHYENPIKTRTGELREIVWNNTTLRDIAGNIVGTASLGEDVTERKRAEVAARSGEAQIREQAKLLDLAQDAIMVRDMEDRVEFWNHGAEQLYGWTATEVHCKKASSFLDKDDPATVAGARAAVIENGKWTGECKHTCKDGGTVMVRSRWTLVRDEWAAPKSILIINTDITEQKKTEEQFLRAQRLESIGTLASGVAHDLNNILVPILMAAPLLRDDMPAEEREKFLAIVESSAERGASIVKQVLTFARGADGDRLLLQPIYLVQEIAKIAGETFPKSIAVRMNYPEDIWTLLANPTQVHQVLLNLCINARDAMPTGGTLTLAVENFEVDDHYASMTPGAKAGPHVLLNVSDTGIGIPPETIDKIFDPFFTTKELGQGTGLGLSTAIGIVKGHGGFMEVDSDVGCGTNFKVFLPANRSELAAQITEAAPLPPANGELLLIVDEENSILQVAKVILEDHGYRVLTAADAAEALAVFALRMNEIDLVLTDLAMPVMDGVALIRTLQKMKPDVRVIASTGRGHQDGRANEIAHLNVRATLTKPYNGNKLITTLHDALRPQ